MKAKFVKHLWVKLMMWFGIFAMIPSLPVAAGDPTFDVSARIGFDAYSDVEYFHLYEIDGRVGFSPYIEWGGGWSLRPALVGAASVLNAAGENGFMAGIGPRLELTFPWHGLTAYATGRPSVLSEYQYGNVDLGGWFTFATDVGIRINLGEYLMIGYVWEHISNANIYNSNPGVNFNVIELSLKF